MIVVGIDPGTKIETSGMAYISSMDMQPQVEPLPIVGNKDVKVDVRRLREWVEGADLIVIEKIQDMGGKFSIAKLSSIYGQLRGGLWDLPVRIVTPQKWHKLTAKESIPFVQDRFPGLDLRRNSRCKPSGHFADAVCMALWGLWNEYGRS